MQKLKEFFINRKNQIILIVTILCCFSLITIYGVTPQLTNYNSDVIPMTFVKKQAIGMVLGFIIMFFGLKVRIWRYEKYINIINNILIVMLVILAFNPPIIGDIFVVTINGAQGWFRIPFLGTIQPVEFFKITMIFKLVCIADLSDKNYIRDRALITQFLWYGALPIGCVLLQPDLGGAILLFAPWLVLGLVSIKNNQRIKRFLKWFSVIFVIGALFIFVPQLQHILTEFTPIKTYQLSRINSWLYPFNYDGGYQLQQSLILMGSAGPFGHGFANVHITLPEPHTDVIFSEFVGMFGYVGGIVLILLYARLLYLTLKVSMIATDFKDKMLVLGFFVLLFVQIFENIGMMLGVLPITGIVLPFMSYGLSALLTYFIVITIVCNISDKYKYIEEKVV